MRDENTIVRERQKTIRREMDRRNISLKAVQLDGGWKSVSTVASYFPLDGGEEPATMSVAALFRLLDRKALSADLLSLLLPDDFIIIRTPQGIDHDELCEAMQDYVAEKAKAHRPDSPAGRELAACEDATLCHKFTIITGRAA